MTGQHFKKLALAALIVAVAACTKQENRSMDLKINIPEVSINFDPQKMEDMFSMMIALQLFRGLMRYDAAGEIRSDLAASWEESTDHLTYKFKLKDMTFSNGKPITSRNVQMSFARMFFLGSSMAADIDYIVGAKDFKSTQDISKLGVRPINDKEIEFKLSHPSALFLKHIAVVDCAILPIDSFKEELDLSSGGSFSGPYRIKNSLEKSKFHLEKWRPDALDSASPPKEIVFFKSAASGINLAIDGKTDSLDYQLVTKSQTVNFEKDGWVSSPTELTGETFVILNPKYVPFEVRKSLYLKTNPNELIRILGEPKFKAAFGLIPTGFPGELSYADISDLHKSNFEYKGKKISFKLDFEPESEMSVKTADWLRKTWSSDSIEVVLNGISKGEKLQRMFEKKAEATIGRKGIDYPDGFSVLTYFKGQYGSNYFHVEDKKIDAAIAQSLQEVDGPKRSAFYKNIQKLILQHYTNIPLLFGSQASGLWSSKVKSVPSHPMGIHTMPFEVIEMRAQ
ncbi:MAG: ABC transporter substrate-binding protein [Bdellovibrionota bacterium]